MAPPQTEVAASVAIATAPTPSRAATPASPEPATPVAQLTPALVQIAHGGGGHQITLRLDPAELGHVDIRIDRAADGSAAVQVTVDRPETLKLMLADQPQLHRALDAAGLPQDGRSVTLSLATPNPGGGGGAHDHSSPTGNDFGAAGGRGDGQGGANTRQGRPQGRPSPLPPQSGAASLWMRAGVDITA